MGSTLDAGALRQLASETAASQAKAMAPHAASPAAMQQYYSQPQHNVFTWRSDQKVRLFTGAFEGVASALATTGQ